MDIKNRLLKQINTGMWWGGFRSVVSSASGYNSWASLTMQAITLYIVSNSSIPGWIFISLGVFFILSVLGFEYKISIPSGIRFSNSQMWKHDNPMRIAIEKCLENDKILMEQNKKIMARLGLE